MNKSQNSNTSCWTLINLTFLIMSGILILTATGATFSTTALAQDSADAPEKETSGVNKAKKCETCGKVYTGDSNFCGIDGGKLIDVETKLVCPKCYKEGTQGEAFCREHGEKLVPIETVKSPEELALEKQKYDQALALYKKGNELSDKEKYDEAFTEYEKAEALYPDIPELQYNMGWLYGKAGNQEEAIRHLREYCRLEPTAPDLNKVASYIAVLQDLLKKKNKAEQDATDRENVLKESLAKTRDKRGMVLIPAGEFIMGTDKARKDARPERKVNLDAYYIDIYEVTVAQYFEFYLYVNETRDHSKCHPNEPKGTDHKPRQWEDDYYSNPEYPINRITWFDAYAYAAWAGKRLPTEAEWEKAARGPEGNAWPWGNEWEPAKCLPGKHPMPVGSLEEGKSVYGCYDMAGSVSEFCSDWYEINYYHRAPTRNPKGPETGIQRIIRGGSRFGRGFLLRSTTRKFQDPDLFNIAVGFRCAKDPS